jgi:hypothetical protein
MTTHMTRIAPPGLIGGSGPLVHSPAADRRSGHAGLLLPAVLPRAMVALTTPSSGMEPG